MPTSVDLASLSLFPATPAQVTESRKRQYPEWAGHLTFEQFTERDLAYDNLEHATGGRMTTWVLAPRDNPQTLDFVCACETYRRDAFVKWSKGKVEEVVGFGIASVYTPDDKCHKGYASYMMRLLHWVLASDSLKEEDFPKAWGSPPPKVQGAGDAKFSVLYSDVGPEFYRTCGPSEGKSGGWEVKGAMSTLWDVPDEAVPEDSRSWRDIQEEEELKVFWEKDTQLMRQTLAARQPEAGKVAAAFFFPHKGVAMFQVPRSKFHTQHLFTLDVWGTELEDPTQDLPTYATWAVDLSYKPRRLLITRMSASSETFPVLLKKIFGVAKRAGLQKVEIWNLDKSLLNAAEALRGRTYERSEHISAFRWYGEEPTSDIQWAFNEKFGWC